MKQTGKRVLIVILFMILAIIAVLAVWAVVLYFISVPDENSESKPEKFAAEYEEIDFHEENGLLYFNREIIVVFREEADKEVIDSYLASLPVSVESSMADIGIYKLTFEEAMTYDELESKVKEIGGNDIVEEAYFNIISEIDTDMEENEESREEFFPKDGWNGDDWDTAAPRGENWGMEAIDAPGAWGYVDELSEINVGLIDSMPDTSHEDLTFSDTCCLFIDTGTGKADKNTHRLTGTDHGCHVSGIMDGDWNNGIGVSGVMGGKGNLYYCASYHETDGRIRSDFGTAYTYLLSLKVLIDQDVQVINISQNTDRLKGFAASHGNRNAVAYLTRQASLAGKGLARIISSREAAGKKDFVICIAAGNNNDTYYYRDEKEAYGYRRKRTFWETIKSLFGWKGEIGGAQASYNNFLNLIEEPEVKDRILVVGCIGMDGEKSSAEETRYKYAAFSNIGERVDVVAPGYDIYSCTAGGYGLMTGTSMSAPHASGVAGLVFAANPQLTGSQVKAIVKNTVKGRYYYEDGFSGMVNARQAVKAALQTRKMPVERVLQQKTSGGLDVCFVVDTTGSMGDDIENAKANMSEILAHLSDKTEDYRVALVDYRDFPDRSGEKSDYPCKIQLDFSDNNEEIIAGINRLDLGNGGDDEETVYSALMEAVSLGWRDTAQKVIIILGDAGPLEPEPGTGYTYEDVLLALYSGNISIDYENSDDRVTDYLDDSLITVFSVGIGDDGSAADFFAGISENTGGNYVGIDDASEVSNAIIDSIEQVEITETVSVRVDFSDMFSDDIIDIYRGGNYLFTMKTDGDGSFLMESMEEDLYRWVSESTLAEGTFTIDGQEEEITAGIRHIYWFTPVLLYFQENRIFCGLAAMALCAFLVFIPVILSVIRTEQPYIFCEECGSRNKKDSAFCGRCGARIDGS